MRIWSRENALLVSEAAGTSYYQYSGTGNTFVLLDNRHGGLRDVRGMAADLCGRFSVDGLLLIEASTKAALKMRILNPDGSEVAMCGNGSRCAAHWAHHHAKFAEKFAMETGAGILNARITGDTVNVRLTDPKDLKGVKDLKVKGSLGAIVFIDTGVPHVVVETQDLDAMDIEGLGSMMRHHKMFQPQGTNASFFQYLGGNRIRCRVYERGVEAETQSCGTGSTACALVASMKHQLDSPVEVTVHSGDTLKIYFEERPEGYANVHLEGKVECLRKGVLTS